MLAETASWRYVNAALFYGSGMYTQLISSGQARLRLNPHRNLYQIGIKDSNICFK